MDQRERAMLLAYVLWNEYNAKQTNIAKVLNVSEPTISLWLKEMRLQSQIHKLTKELEEVRKIANGLACNGQIEQRRTYELLE